MATKLFILTSGTSWTVPNDWNSSNNTIECIGAGGSGNATAAASNRCCGGAGGYSKITNLSLTPGNTVTYAIGAGGASVTLNTLGVNGGDTYFNGASLAASSVGAQGGRGFRRAAVYYWCCSRVAATISLRYRDRPRKCRLSAAQLYWCGPRPRSSMLIW